MRWDLKKPCKHCPFANTPTRIVFACRERAEEIEEHAYRHGFPCHEHAEWTDDDDGNGGAEFRQDGTTQHCVGALLMWLNEGYDGNVPFENLSDKQQTRIRNRVEWPNNAFETTEDFINANEAKLQNVRAVRSGRHKK